MEFALSEEQEILSESVSKMIESVCDVDIIRNHSGGDKELRNILKDQFVEMGLPGLLIPEEYGGSGLGVFEASLVAEQIGKYVAPVLWVANSVMVPISLSDKGSSDLAEKWLPQIAKGEVSACIAINEVIGSREDAGLNIEKGKISGTSIFALDGEHEPRIIVTVVDNNFYLVDTKEEDVEISEIPTIDSTRPVSEVIFNSCKAEEISGGKEIIDKVIDAGRVVLAADMLGTSDSMLKKAVEYSLERKQFNRVIGSFQAVKHMCAEMAAELEPCRSLVWYSAYAQDSIPEESRLAACHAKAHLSEVAHNLARIATQVHGGMGFTDLLGLHYWFKRIGLARQILGGPGRVRKEAAEIQGFGVQV
mgnify:CR=1 FL=1